MCASPLSFLRSGPPPPKVVLLPDGLFFSRTVPITAGATAADVNGQIELALESLSPFPLPQLYYGWYWVAGADHAFVYATYRRRFTTDQTAAWADAELVLPASAALFGGKVEPATAILLTSPEGLTAVYWETSQVPSRVVSRPISPEATEEERARIRDEVLRSFGGSRTVIDLLVPPAADAADDDNELIFRSGDFVSRIPAARAAALDVRDKGELAALRAGRKRDLVLWRVTLGCAAALLLLLVGELALVGGNQWQKVQIAKRDGRASTVQKIKEADDLARSIDDLVTKRLLPLEMVTSIVGASAERKPTDVVITQIQSGGAGLGLYTLRLRLETTNGPQVLTYKNELLKLPECQNVELTPGQSNGDRSVFEMTITFKPGVLKPEAA